MKLSRRTKRVAAFAALWVGIIMLAALIISFPKLSMFVLLGSAAAILARETWELVGSYING